MARLPSSFLNRSAPALCAALLASACLKGVQELPPNPALDRAAHDLHFPIAVGPHAVDCNSCHGSGESFTKFDCLGCHAQPPTAALHVTVPSYQWASASCFACHPRGTGGISTAQHASYFPIATTDTHALGATFAASGGSVTEGCTTCHQDPAVRKNVTCTSCHTASGTNAAKPGPIDLAPAHARLAGPSWQASGTPTPQCLQCHANDFLEHVSVHGSGSTPAFASEHPGTAFVIDSGNSSHFKACELCHTSQITSDPSLKNPRLDFNARTCSGCHSEAKDNLVTNHNLISVTPAIADTVDASGNPAPGHATRCLTCHPGGESAPSNIAFSHPQFPVTSGSTHALGTSAVHAPGKFQCASCHTARATDPQQLDCTSCHTQAQMKTSAGTSFHQAVPDLNWPRPATPQATSLFCLRCHADSKVPAQVSSSTSSSFGKHDSSNAAIVFSITPGTAHDTANGTRPMACLTCHSVASAPYPGIPNFLVTDFVQRTCTACHLQTGTLNQDLGGIHAGVTSPAPGFTAVPPAPISADYSKTCVLCHANGQIDAALVAQNHANFFPVGSADSHAYGKVVTVGAAPVTVSCSTCHVDTANRRNVDCTTCHLQSGSSGAPMPAVAADQKSAHAGKVGTTGTGGVADNLWLGTGPVGTGSGESANCLKCHAADGQKGGYVARHGAASAKTGNSVFAIDAASTNHAVSCDQCHTALVTNANRKNPEFDFANNARCDLCHLPAATISEHAKIPYNGQPGVVIDPAKYTASNLDNATQCLSCHTSGGPATNFTHASFPIAAGEKHSSGIAKCATCHSDTTTYSGTPAGNVAKITCTSCHDDSANNVKNQGGLTTTAVHRAARVGLDIWDVPGGLAYAGGSAAATNSLCLKCHAGNVGASVARWSTPLVFRLSQHDAHCGLNGKDISNPNSDSTHWVSRNADNGVNTCFACHNALATGSATPWAADWSVASPTTSCIACHEHQNNVAPAVTCK